MVHNKFIKNIIVIILLSSCLDFLGFDCLFFVPLLLLSYGLFVLWHIEELLLDHLNLGDLQSVAFVHLGDLCVESRVDLIIEDFIDEVIGFHGSGDIQ